MKSKQENFNKLTTKNCGIECLGKLENPQTELLFRRWGYAFLIGLLLLQLKESSRKLMIINCNVLKF